MHDVHHAYDNIEVVSGVDLTVAPGEVVCLLGPSGCGKTTLLRIAAGLEALQHGSLALEGQQVAAPGRRHLPPERRNVGLAFQDSALFPHLSVLDNVTFGLRQLPTRDRQRRGMKLLEQLGMADYAKVYPHMLSGGQQQRVALARALAPGPGLMLLDEPFSSLDARLRDQIRDDTLHVLKQVGAATLLVTHDPEEAMFMADRIALMRDGRIVQTGTPWELYCTPCEPFVVSFFGEVNELQGEVREGKVATPVGQVDASWLPEGSQARVMIRPEALIIQERKDDAGDHQVSHVLMAKLLGRSSLLHICAHGASGQESHMHARVPGVFLPATGQAVDISLDLSQVFVFPSLGAGTRAAHGDTQQDHREYAHSHDGQ
ncbi:ABC transporter ATP-binding protein [Halomonas urumqiensis]|uniref:ABC transporter ATP-binding protein n=1 Tax=Halomonas urumqiensis TaxID=1684789 RepID=A0A2N7ULG7_9GAMM|nr:ABC transporter ATP-binding protein [Halomonas urumqiensis]PMR81229.1 ABC transporter ATP-binding protein [Halomonas urumqiensis]PTB01760.1 ABC transporter ATP-binding protein [Halomonas urumqiensis]GHE22139.1 ABC transporter [Halomonas urumqiensis]